MTALALRPELKMEPNWLRCTSNDGDEVHVNLSAATLIAPHKKGSRISFPGEKDNHVDVKEKPEEIMSKGGVYLHPSLSDD